MENISDRSKSWFAKVSSHKMIQNSFSLFAGFKYFFEPCSALFPFYFSSLQSWCYLSRHFCYNFFLNLHHYWLEDKKSLSFFSLDDFFRCPEKFISFYEPKCSLFHFCSCSYWPVEVDWHHSILRLDQSAVWLWLAFLFLNAIHLRK